MIEEGPMTVGNSEGMKKIIKKSQKLPTFAEAPQSLLLRRRLAKLRQG